MNNFQIRIPRKQSAFGRPVRWRKIKELVLGKKYALSVALVADKEMRRAENMARHKKHANVLSFAYEKNSGEILLNVSYIRRETRILKQPLKERLVYLYIHSLLHLKGHDHKKPKDERKMLREEKRYMIKSGF